MTIVMKAWFRAVAACFRSEATAQAVGGFSILVLTIYTGMFSTFGGRESDSDSSFFKASRSLSRP